MVSAVGTRRTVTVLFCDLAGSTALGERLDPEVLRTVLSHWYDAMREPVERHGGTVEKFVGDAVMAVFGIPHVHEDDALRAVRAAVEMQEAAARVVAELSAPLPVRIGVYSGEVVTGDARTTLVTGDAVNTAKRLEERAAEGEILIGETTRRLVENAVRLEEAGRLRAKGKRRPVAAWRVLGTIPDAPVFARRLDAPLVGRARELDTLLGELAAAERGRECRLVTVLGPAGIGKSRLASELAALVRERTTVLGARCLPYGDGITFWPLVQLLRDAGGDEAIAAALAGEPDAPLVASRLSGARGGGDGAPAPADETFWALRRLLETLARERTLLVVLEDLHWGEPTFLDLVEYLAGWSRGAILLLCVARPELLDARPRWAGATVALEPLSEEDSQALLDALAAEWPVTAEARERIAATAEGNPLFVEQLVAMLAEDGESGLELPPSIHALLEARLDRLEPLERRVLGRAAVIGKEFWRGAVAELSPEEDRPELAAALLRLVRKELVRPWSSSFVGEDAFRFRHGLIRDAAYASLRKAERAGLHERFADWLEAHATGEASDEIRGYHLEQAVRLHDELAPKDEQARALAARAHELLADAGRRASARGDAPAARNLLERALALDRGDPDGSALELRRILAGALWETGETERALELVEAVAADAAVAGERATEWYARLDAAGMRGPGAPEGVEAFLATASRAVEVFSELEDERGLARAWRRISLAERLRCSYAAAEAAADRALRYALRCGDRQDAARAADVLCTSLLWGPRPVDEGLRRCEELLAAGEGNDPLRANVLAALAGLRALEGEFATARGLRAEAEQIYRDRGMRMSVAGLTQLAAQIERLAGDPTAAEAELRTGLEIVRGGGGEALQQGWLAAALVAQSRHEEALAAAEAARAAAAAEDVIGQVVWRGALARIDAAAGRVGAALALAREAVDRAALTDGLPMRADALLDLAAVLETAGEPEQAECAAREASDLYGRKGRVDQTARTR